MFLLCSSMPNEPPADRVSRLKDWASVPSGYVVVARCRDCGHRAALPVAILLRRFGESTPIDRVVGGITCSSCQSHAIEIRAARLCDPGCARQRG